MKKSTKRQLRFIAGVLLICLGITYVILIIVPKSTAIEIDVSAKRVNFSLPPEIVGGEQVALLYSGMWVNSISIERFQPIKLMIDSLQTSEGSRMVKNTLIVSPEPLNGRITFYSLATGISLQEVVCDSGSHVALQRDGDNFSIEIRASHQPPYLILSLDEMVGISTQACSVIDIDGREFTQLFNQHVNIKFHEIARSLSIGGKIGELYIRIENARLEREDRPRFVLEQLVQNLEFSKNIYGLSKNISQSTVDSIFVKMSFLFENKKFESSNIGDLDIKAEPARFVILDLSESPNGLKVRAQGRFRSFKIGQGVLWHELVPRYLDFLLQHKTISVIITWLGGLATIVVELLLKTKLEN